MKGRCADGDSDLAALVRWLCNGGKMEAELEKKLLIDVARLESEGEILEGEVDIVDLDEEFVHPFGGVRYRLKAQLFNTELVVQGHLEQDFDLVCSRCDREFDTTVKVDDFCVSCEVPPAAEFVDLTTEARESIILALPTYPLCDEDCPGLQQKVEKPADGRWSALDGLKVE